MRTNISKLALAVTFGLVFVFTVSCSSGNGGEKDIPSSNSEGNKHNYCVFIQSKICLDGPFDHCDEGGSLSNTCPFSSSNSEQASSSSGSLTPISSSSTPSSSSVLTYYSSIVWQNSSSSDNGGISQSSSNSSVISSSSSETLSSSSILPSSSSVTLSSSSVIPSSSSATPSSSSIVSSSSNVEPSSSSSSIAIVSNTFTDSRDGNVYKWVKIGEQVWMAENLKYNVSGSKCYDNSETNCDKYGRLYDKTTAMSVCPSGWHLPNNAEWDKLMRYVDGGTGTSVSYDSPAAGKYLKAISGWDYKSGTVNLDTYGFSAMPGGYGGPDEFFVGEGSRGHWWISDFGNLYMLYSGDFANYKGNGDYSSLLFSVRCLQGNTPSTSNGTFRDSRDGKTYKYVTIGNQKWMAENLKYVANANGSTCYDNSSANCDTYGMLYNWSTAMGFGEQTFSGTTGFWCDANYVGSAYCQKTIDSPHRGICPEGWHLPSANEWRTLGYINGLNTNGFDSSAGTKLKASSGWNSGGNGTDSYGFAALPGGRSVWNKSYNYYDVGEYGYWWIALESEAGRAYAGTLSYSATFAPDPDPLNSKSTLFSVRCIMD